MKKQKTEERAAGEKPAAPKEGPRAAAAAVPGARSAEGLTTSPGPKAPEEREPLMSGDVKVADQAGPLKPSGGSLSTGDVPRKSSEHVEPTEPDWRVRGAELAGDNKSFVSLNASDEELATFAGAIRARQAAEKTQRPGSTFWVCPRCRRQERAAADAKSAVCFFCNPRLLPSGQYMTQIVDEAGIAAFLARERLEQEAWRKSLAKAKEIAKKKDAELALLRRHGM
jgi:hypothetical protein